MEAHDTHGRFIAQAFYTELEKIAYAMHPGDIAKLVSENAALRKAARPDLLQKLRPGTGSLFEAIGDRVKGAVGGMRTKGKATEALSGMARDANPEAAKNIFEQNEALKRLGSVREAERALHGPGLTGVERPPAGGGFFGGMPSPSKGQHSTLRNVAFGAGLGAGGLAAGQMYLNSTQEPQY